MRPRIAAPVLAAALAAAFLVPGIAAAGGRNEPILADLNGDGRVDRATLGPETGVPSGTPTCTISVEAGKHDGTYGRPVVHSYPSPWTRQPYCPDMGEAINLAHNGKTELVLTSFNASPARNALFALRNYKLAGVFTGVDFPNTIQSADFDGDGRIDIWESSNESFRLRTFTNTGAGTLVPGSISVCSEQGVPQHVLADFNGDGGQDFLVTLKCFGNETVQVLFGDGQPPVTLVTGGGTVFTVDLDGNGVPDAGVITDTGTRLFHNDGHGAFTETTMGSAAATLAAQHAPMPSAAEQASHR